MKNFVLLGPPGAGKGSVAVLLSEALGLPHISTGAMFRGEIEEKTELGLEAQSYMERGALVPDELTNRILARRLSEEDAREGFLLDGYPRNLEQADVLDNLLEKQGRTLTAALFIDVPEDLIIRRLSRRHVCSSCGLNYNLDAEQVAREKTRCTSCDGSLKRRADDEPEKIQHRLKVYAEKSRPLVDLYEARKKLLRFTNVDGALEATCKAILDAIDQDGR